MDVISQVIVLFLLMLCGFLSTKLRLISDEGISGLNNLVIYFALPCLTVAKLQTDADAGLARGLAQVFFISGAVMLLCGLIARFLLFRGEEERRRAVFTAMSLFPNVGYMGYPLLTAAFGAENLIYCVMYNAMFNILSWSVGVVLYDRRALDVRRILRVPSLLGAVIGVALFALRIRLPGVLYRAMDSMGSVTTPLAMFIIGTRLTRLRASDLRDARLLLVCGLRLLAFPLLTWLCLLPFGLSSMVLAQIVLCTAMPGAAIIVIQAETYGGDSALASRAVALSTLLSILTIPLILLVV